MPTVVVVEDEPLVRLAISEMLIRHGFSTLVFESSIEALAAIVALREQPACLVTDLRMPGVSGWDIARTARQAFLDIPVLYMTGGAASDLVLQAVDNSAYIQKPFTESAFLRSIEALAGGASSMPPAG